MGFSQEDLTEEFLAGAGLEILSAAAAPRFIEREDNFRRLKLSRAQWRKLSRRTQVLLESGVARVEHLHISEPLRFATARRGDRNEK
jgi:hypothetical protein